MCVSYKITYVVIKSKLKRKTHFKNSLGLDKGQCHYCGKQVKRNLNRHVETVHEGRKIQCNDTGNFFDVWNGGYPPKS